LIKETRLVIIIFVHFQRMLVHAIMKHVAAKSFNICISLE